MRSFRKLGCHGTSVLLAPHKKRSLYEMMPGKTVVKASMISACARRSLDSDRGLRGVVHSVHRCALNILWNNELISILTPEIGNFPNALTAQVDCVSQLFCVGDYVFRVSEGLVIKSSAPVLFDLRQAVTWSPVLKPIVPVGGWSAVSARLRFILPRAGVLTRSGGFAPLLRALGSSSARAAQQSFSPLCRYALGEITELLHALAASDATGLKRCTRALIGLGVGLTPSGDDLLVGMLASLAAAGDARATLLANTILAAPCNDTTILAHTLLRHACEFEFSSRLHAVVGAFFASSRYALGRRVLAATAWGESSGADSLLGVVLGLSAALARLRQDADLSSTLEKFSALATPDRPFEKTTVRTR